MKTLLTALTFLFAATASYAQSFGTTGTGIRVNVADAVTAAIENGSLDVATGVHTTANDDAADSQHTSDISGLFASTTTNRGLAVAAQATADAAVVRAGDTMTGNLNLNGNSILQSNGDVGIGLTNPSGRLHVTTDATGGIPVLFVENGTGDLGFGTANPTADFHFLGLDIPAGISGLNASGFQVLSGDGGDNTSTGSGGLGGFVSLLAGRGGDAEASGSGFGAQGGAITIKSGFGGDAGASNASTGRAGGAITIEAEDGGESGTGQGGTGGRVDIRGGIGHSASGTSQSIAGLGGNATLSGGAGGTGNGTSGAAGNNGGPVTITGGSGGGTFSGATGADGGDGANVDLNGGPGGQAAPAGGDGGDGGDIVINPGAGGVAAGGTPGVDGNVVLVNLRGNVGVGTSTPGEKLTVSGNARFTGAVNHQSDINMESENMIDFESGGSISQLQIKGLTSLPNIGAAGGYIKATNRLEIDGAATIQQFATGNIALFSAGTAGGTPTLNLDNLGNFAVHGDTLTAVGGRVGIGTSAPSQALDVVGDIAVSETITLGLNKRLYFNENTRHHISGDLNLKVQATNEFDTAKLILAANSGASAAIQLNTSGLTRIHITNAGLVGIGTTAPDNLFHVAGDAKFDGSVSSPGQHRAHAQSSSSQSIPDDTEEIGLLFGNEITDIGGNLDNVGVSTFTVSVAGWYQINCNAQWATNATGQRALIIQHNGDSVARTRHDAASSQRTNQSVSFAREMAVSDTIRCVAEQNSGAPLNVETGAGTNISIIKVW